MMTINCKTPGLRIDWINGGSFLYGCLVHVGSGKTVRAFTSKPIEGGKRRFAAAVDACMSCIDWTCLEVDMIADGSKIREKIYEIPYDCR